MIYGARCINRAFQPPDRFDLLFCFNHHCAWAVETRRLNVNTQLGQFNLSNKDTYFIIFLCINGSKKPDSLDRMLKFDIRYLDFQNKYQLKSFHKVYCFFEPTCR